MVKICSKKERGARNDLVPLISGTRSCLVPVSKERNAFLLRSSKKRTSSREWRSQERVPNALHIQDARGRQCISTEQNYWGLTRKNSYQSAFLSDGQH